MAKPTIEELEAQIAELKLRLKHTDKLLMDERAVVRGLEEDNKQLQDLFMAVRRTGLSSERIAIEVAVQPFMMQHAEHRDEMITHTVMDAVQSLLRGFSREARLTELRRRVLDKAGK